MIATVFAVAIVVISCSSSLSTADNLSIKEVPYQVVDNMYVLQTKDGLLQMRIKAGVMERYDRDTMELELFPKGIEVFAYTAEGLLESELFADKARHEKAKKGDGEKWMAFGRVKVRNVIKKETIETDTLYWDRKLGEIYNDCYVRLYSPDGFIQGYGLRSDDRAANAVILQPFNNYFIVVQDTTKVAVDSANFIGPLIKK